MRVILLEDVRSIGKRGQVIEVKDGYARNYLFPRHLAEEATDGRIKQVKEREAAQADKAARALADARALAARLHDLTITIQVRAGEGGRLFGAVTNGDVAQQLIKMGFEVDRKQLRMDPIKALGTHRVRLHLHEGVNTEMTVQVDPR